MTDTTRSANLDEAQRLKEFWDARYQQFSLGESGIKGLSPKYSELLYRCKRKAWERALSLARIDTTLPVAILDGGCGQGYFASLATQLFRQHKYTGVDISQKAIDHLGGTPAPGGGAWICGDLANPSLQIGGPFDVAQSIEVLHLIMDDANHSRAIEALSSPLRPGGLLLLTDTLPATRYSANEYITFRPIEYYRQLFDSLDLDLIATFPIYYCIPDAGFGTAFMRRICRHIPPECVYWIDRIALKLRLPQLNQSHDCKMKMLVCRKRLSK